MGIKKIASTLLIGSSLWLFSYLHFYVIDVYYIKIFHTSSIIFRNPLYTLGIFAFFWILIGYFLFTKKRSYNGIFAAVLTGCIAWIPSFYILLFTDVPEPFRTSFSFYTPLAITAVCVWLFVPQILKNKLLTSKQISITSICLAIVIFGIGLYTIYLDNEGSQFVKGCKAINNQDATYENIQKIGPVARWDGHNVTFREVSKEEFDEFVKDSQKFFAKTTITDDTWQCFLRINKNTNKLETHVSYSQGN